MKVVEGAGGVGEGTHAFRMACFFESTPRSMVEYVWRRKEFLALCGRSRDSKVAGVQPAGCSCVLRASFDGLFLRLRPSDASFHHATLVQRLGSNQPVR